MSFLCEGDGALPQAAQGAEFSLLVDMQEPSGHGPEQGDWAR